MTINIKYLFIGKLKAIQNITRFFHLLIPSCFYTYMLDLFLFKANYKTNFEFIFLINKIFGIFLYLLL